MTNLTERVLVDAFNKLPDANETVADYYQVGIGEIGVDLKFDDKGAEPVEFGGGYFKKLTFKKVRMVDTQYCWALVNY